MNPLLLTPEGRAHFEHVLRVVPSTACDRWLHVARAMCNAGFPCTPIDAEACHAALHAEITGQLSALCFMSPPGSTVASPVTLGQHAPSDRHFLMSQQQQQHQHHHQQQQVHRVQRSMSQGDVSSLLAHEAPLTPTQTPGAFADARRAAALDLAGAQSAAVVATPPPGMRPRAASVSALPLASPGGTPTRTRAAATARSPASPSTTSSTPNGKGARGKSRRSLVTNAGAWTGEEHENFLRGLAQYGKSQWRKISDNYVPSRNPQQIASHAQKYFARQAQRKASIDNMCSKPRRPSIHDFTLDTLADMGVITPEEATLPGSPAQAAPVSRTASFTSDAGCQDGHVPASCASKILMSPKPGSPKKPGTPMSAPLPTRRNSSSQRRSSSFLLNSPHTSGPSLSRLRQAVQQETADSPVLASKSVRTPSPTTMTTPTSTTTTTTTSASISSPSVKHERDLARQDQDQDQSVKLEGDLDTSSLLEFPGFPTAAEGPPGFRAALAASGRAGAASGAVAAPVASHHHLFTLPNVPIQAEDTAVGLTAASSSPPPPQPSTYIDANPSPLDVLIGANAVSAHMFDTVPVYAVRQPASPLDFDDASMFPSPGSQADDVMPEDIYELFPAMYSMMTPGSAMDSMLNH